jgi:flagellar hook-associated protein 3
LVIDWSFWFGHWGLIMAIIPLQLARVSNLLRTNVATQSLTRTQQDLLIAENQLSTGKRINSPSDDPGAAAVAQQLHKTMEQRLAYAENLKQATNQLSQVDSSLGDLGDLLQQAQTIASANVGSDVTPDQRKAAAEIVKSLYNEALSIGNKQFNGIFIFAGDRATDAPFAETNGGVKFVGSERLLTNTYDENTKLPFQVDGEEVFGALSSRVKGTADLSPSVTTATRLADLNGAAGNGIHLGSVQISDGTTVKVVDLSGADTINDIINTINAAGAGVTASIAPGGTALQLTGGGGSNITVTEVGGGTTATDLGILNTTGAGTTLTGTSVGPKLTMLTPLAQLRAGAGIDLTGLTITNGTASATIAFTGATTVEDLINKINGAGVGVRAQINAAGTGIDILNSTQGTQLTIAEAGGTTAADMGVRSFGPATPLTELNDGKGVKTVAGNDLQITDSSGTSFQVDINGATTVQDVLNAINAAATGAGAGVTASFATSGNGIVLSDTAGGTGTIGVNNVNFSRAAEDLGLTVAPSGTTINGADVNPVAANGIFAHLAQLRDALQASDTDAITAAAEGLKEDGDRVTNIRGATGARVKELESRQEGLDGQNIATKSLLSQLEDTDYTEAIARFSALQTSLQASLQTASKVMNLSLLDFLG